MSFRYFYADENSLDVLSSNRQKAILVGGDFGYGNFGDVLQHQNAVALVKQAKKHAVVSIMAANAINSPCFSERTKRIYNLDAIIFVSDYPLILDEKSPDLKCVASINNLNLVHLYGGGFLNERWGDYVLSVVEQILTSVPDALYVVSGQQITAPYQKRVLEHIRKFNPKLFGVRDDISFKLLEQEGYTPYFSFDDATEALFALNGRIPLKKSTEGFILHINTSDYTANGDFGSGISHELTLLNDSNLSGEVTLLQAFRDNREDVTDSRETIKKLDALFPFSDYRSVELVRLLLDDAPCLSKPIVGSYGVSCSYHVALWLQLAGIPCWLRSGNPFYDQKSNALQVSLCLQDFIRNPKLANHAINLERRFEWRQKLLRMFAEAPPVYGICQLSIPNNGLAPWTFFYKGFPTKTEKICLLEQELEYKQKLLTQERLVSENCKAEVAQQEINKFENESLKVEVLTLRRSCQDLQSGKESLSARLMTLTCHTSTLGHELHTKNDRVKSLELDLEIARRENCSLETRIESLTQLTTSIGHECHVQKERAEAALRAVDDLTHRQSETKNHLDMVLTSRSWRVTKPIRAIVRYIKCGSFDSQGMVNVRVLVGSVLKKRKKFIN